MGLHDGFHRVDRTVSCCISVLGFILQEVAAALLDACHVAGLTRLAGRLTLYTTDLNCLNLGPASGLCSLYGSLSAQLCCGFVTGADKAQNLRGVRNVAVNRDDRSGLACNQRLDGLSLQRCDDVSVIIRRVKIGLDHSNLLFKSGFRGRTLDIYLNAMLCAICLSLAVLPILSCQRLKDYADLLGLAARGLFGIRGFCSRCGIVSRSVFCATAARGHRQCHCARQCCCHPSLLVHLNISPLSSLVVCF